MNTESIQKKDCGIMEKIKNKSPLRYPGGKTRACKVLNKMIQENFDTSKFQTLVSPFLGGGSFEFHLQHEYGWTIVANDKFAPLYNFWNICKTRKRELCEELYKRVDKIEKSDFTTLRSKIMEEKDPMEKAVMYFIINRCSFSGSTLSGGFSLEASKKRFTKSSVDRIGQLNLANFNIEGLDFVDFLGKNAHCETTLLFLDPPYYLEKNSKLYGKKGDMHENFDHDKLFQCLSKRKNWFMTYNNCEYIRNLYKDYKIFEVNWSYGMCNVQSKSKEEKAKMKKSSEIVIVG